MAQLAASDRQIPGVYKVLADHTAWFAEKWPCAASEARVAAFRAGEPVRICRLDLWSALYRAQHRAASVFFVPSHRDNPTAVWFTLTVDDQVTRDQ
jgi:hypothetical protein